MKDEYSEFSHTLKNSLAVIKAYNQLLKRKLADRLAPAEVDAFDKIEKQTEKIEALVDTFRNQQRDG